ncbi:MAG: DUF4097 family beta strand repeat-containing protein [Anaerolineaceae bacterium]|nr:DUF4097 family beta strand repeat-containing protein [Anaerolineaceae bacterium]
MKTKTLYLTGALLVLFGLIIGGVGLAMVDFNLSRLSNDAIRLKKTFQTSEAFNTISIEGLNQSIKILPSSDDQIHLSWYESSSAVYALKNEEGNLSLRQQVKPFLGFRIEIPTPAYDITLALPSGFSGLIDCKISNGSISAERVGAGSLRASSMNGSVVLNALKTSGPIQVYSSNGSIQAIQTETQSVMTLETRNGSILLEKAAVGKELNCRSSNGRIEGSIAGTAQDFTIESHSANGSNSLEGITGHGEKKLVANSSNGAIDLRFSQ